VFAPDGKEILRLLIEGKVFREFAAVCAICGLSRIKTIEKQREMVGCLFADKASLETWPRPKSGQIQKNTL
jgi:hypothetical protein